MSIKQVLFYPDNHLRVECTKVDEFTEDIEELIQDLKDTCRAYRAHGLAAPQIGVAKRVFVTHIDRAEEPTVFINPEITDKSEETVKEREGCLSFPTAEEVIERSEDVTISAMNEVGEEFTLSLDGIEAVAVQHENDHLDGVLFIDYMSPLQKRLFLKKVSKAFKQPKQRNMGMRKELTDTQQKKLRNKRKKQRQMRKKSR